jgi:hypothetical protein
VDLTDGTQPSQAPPDSYPMVSASCFDTSTRCASVGARQLAISSTHGTAASACD